MEFIKRNALIVALVAACAFLIACFAAMSWQPISTDEGDFMLAAMDWYARRSAIPHPQLYIHLMQAAFAMFGTSVTSARAVNLFATIATTLMLPALAKFAFRAQLDATAVRRAQLIAVALWALCPLVVQNMMLIDIDNGVLTTALVLTLLVWLGMANRPGRELFTGLAFALALWTKLTTPVLLLLALLAFYLFQFNWRMLGRVALAGAIGVGAFVVSHSVYALFTNYTLLDAAAAFFWRSGQGGSILSSIPTIAPQAMGVIAFWVGLPVVLLALGPAWQAIAHTLQRKLNDADLLMFFVAAVALFYGSFIVPPWGYPRYHTPGYAALTVALGGFVGARLGNLSRGAMGLAVGVVVVVAGLQIALIGDPLFDIYRATFDTVSLVERIRVGSGAVLKLLALLAAGLACLWVLRRRLGMTTSRSLTLGLLAVALGAFIGVNAVQVPAAYSTRYRYTYRYADRAQANDFVRANVPADGFMLADRDVLWYSGRGGDLVYEFLKPGAFQQALAARRVDALVWTEKEWLKSPLKDDAASMSLLNRCFAQTTFGIFTVAVRNSTCAELP